MYLNEEVQAAVSEAFDITARAMAAEPLLGENPDVYTYKLKESSSMVIFYFCFYEGSTAIVRFKKILFAR